jgi:hypothetical protein
MMASPGRLCTLYGRLPPVLRPRRLFREVTGLELDVAGRGLIAQCVFPQRGWNGASSQPESMDRAAAGRTTCSVQGKLRIGSASGEDIAAQIRNEQSLEVFPLVSNHLLPTKPDWRPLCRRWSGWSWWWRGSFRLMIC